jgi:hypothetical protein
MICAVDSAAKAIASQDSKANNSSVLCGTRAATAHTTPVATDDCVANLAIFAPTAVEPQAYLNALLKLTNISYLSRQELCMVLDYAHLGYKSG